MARVVSVWLPWGKTDRLRQGDAAPPADAPLVTLAQDGARRVLDAVDARAHALGLRPGQSWAEAAARVPGLIALPADPAAETAWLTGLARWAQRYTPLAAPDPPDGLWLEIAGSAHLLGGEAALLADLRRRLAAMGITARAAVADTPGAAWALARFGGADATVVPVDGAAAALADLPPAALRLEPDALALLERLGIERIGALAALPRGPLARRLGMTVPRRLDQVLGRVAEPIAPLPAPAPLAARLAFPEPLLEAAPLAAAIAALSEQVCARLEAAGLGARALALRLVRVDGTAAELRAGTAQASRAAAHLAGLLAARLERIDPGLGIAEMSLRAARTETLGARQTGLDGSAAAAAALAELLDRLANRLGPGRVWRAAPGESLVPERMVQRLPPLAPAAARWPEGLPRPPRLLAPPQPIEALAL
ncbi:MAG: DNA polymerase Y family protein, partial [Rhodospirillales bacterium]|nr:DNA polymerase Y family protein [Rhodospirillales bacterium]